MARYFVITGLPASGKTTVGLAVASGLRLPLIDKDTILEAMFETMGVGDAAWRGTLSRAADLVLQRLACASRGAVLVSWWRHPHSTMPSGTPADWLRSLPGEVIELHCRCASRVAVDRFFARDRHPGHLDRQRSRERELDRFTAAEALGAMNVGRVVEVATDEPFDVQALLRRLQAPGAPGPDDS